MFGVMKWIVPSTVSPFKRRPSTKINVAVISARRSHSDLDSGRDSGRQYADCAFLSKAFGFRRTSLRICCCAPVQQWPWGVNSTCNPRPVSSEGDGLCEGSTEGPHLRRNTPNMELCEAGIRFNNYDFVCVFFSMFFQLKFAHPMHVPTLKSLEAPYNQTSKWTRTHSASPVEVAG